MAGYRRAPLVPRWYFLSDWACLGGLDRLARVAPPTAWVDRVDVLVRLADNEGKILRVSGS